MQSRQVQLSNQDREHYNSLLNSERKLEDGGKTLVKCSTCKKGLIEVWIIQPDTPITTEIYATCPYCGDKSFLIEVRGKFSLGHLDDTVIIDVEDEECKIINEFIKQRIKVLVEKE